MRILLITTFTLLSFFSLGQDLNKKIKKIKTIDQANEFIKSYPNLIGEIIEINSGTDSSNVAKQLFTNKIESPITIDGYTYKILETKISFLLRVSYIYLNGDKLAIQQIDTLRKIIISKYNSGTSFPDLAKEYNMDGNPNCDLGWIPAEMMVKDFSTVVKEHKKDDIFTVDVPSKKWYYVTLKTFDDREVRVFTVMKIKSSA